MQDYSIDIQLAHPDDMMSLFGTNERHLKVIEKALNVTIHARVERVQVIGEESAVEVARLVINALLVLVGHGMLVNTSDVVTALNMAQNGTIDKFVALYEEEIIKDNYGKPIRVKTLGQKVYVDSVKKHDIVFGIGPAGTGKTFLAVTLAVTALKRGQVKRIILTRPAVEAGESLGFLPGDLKEKVDPYLRPVYDALYQILGKEQTTRLMEREIIEIAPLAYMRGRTLDDAFVILDEAQNTTIMQMKMFLTRLGFNSKMIVNGDTSQIDLPRNVKSGLHGIWLVLGIVFNFVIGVLMTMGLGNYAPELIFFSLMGLSPTVAMPVMMLDAAMIMTASSTQFIKSGRVNWDGFLGLVVGGIIGVIVAVLFLTNLNLNSLKLLVVFIVLFTGGMLIRSSFKKTLEPSHSRH